MTSEFANGMKELLWKAIENEGDLSKLAQYLVIVGKMQHNQVKGLQSQAARSSPRFSDAAKDKHNDDRQCLNKNNDEASDRRTDNENAQVILVQSKPGPQRRSCEACRKSKSRCIWPQKAGQRNKRCTTCVKKGHDCVLRLRKRIHTERLTLPRATIPPSSPSPSPLLNGHGNRDLAAGGSRMGIISSTGDHLVLPNRTSRQGAADVCASQVSLALAASQIHAAAHPSPFSSWLNGAHYDHPINLAESDIPAGDPAPSTRDLPYTSNTDTDRTLSPVASQPHSVLHAPVQRRPIAITCRYCRNNEIRCSGSGLSEDCLCNMGRSLSQRSVFRPVSDQDQVFVPAHTTYERSHPPRTIAPLEACKLPTAQP